MTSIRPQYHLRQTDTGIDAWDVKRLISLAEELTPYSVDPGSFEELNNNHWYFQNTRAPTPLSIIEHIRLIQDCDLAYPVILDADGRVMDGMHRICKAILEDVPSIQAVRFEVDPEPDFVDCDPAALPYE